MRLIEIERGSDCFPKAEKIYNEYIANLKPELKEKWEVKSKIEIEGNQKLIEKYQYDELPWIRQIFHLGTHDPFDRIEK